MGEEVEIDQFNVSDGSTGDGVKAVVLLSGGLDSALAAQIVKDQGVEVFGLNFHSPFCVCNTAKTNFECGALFFAQKIDIPIKFKNKDDEYLRLVKNPKFGYGKNLNPCIDCRIYILKYAKQYADEIGASFVITGEVLGQRPKSQTLNAINIIDRESGMAGNILRPLSAKLFKETNIEESGIVDREKLFEIQGRSRNIQLELGKEFNLIRAYCASGGCLLTDKNFSRKVRDYFKYTKDEDIKMEDMHILKIGRHFRHGTAKIIVGKNQSDNHWLEARAKKGDILIQMRDVVGPTTIIYDFSDPDQLGLATQLTFRYSDAEEGREEVAVVIEIGVGGYKKEPKNISEIPITRDVDVDFKEFYI